MTANYRKGQGGGIPLVSLQRMSNLLMGYHAAILPRCKNKEPRWRNQNKEILKCRTNGGIEKILPSDLKMWQNVCGGQA